MQDAGGSCQNDEEPADYRSEEKGNAFWEVSMGTKEGHVRTLTILEDEDDQDKEHQESDDHCSPIAARSRVREGRLL